MVGEVLLSILGFDHYFKYILPRTFAIKHRWYDKSPVVRQREKKRRNGIGEDNRTIYCHWLLVD
jgi:hypothetical protein